MPIKGIQSLICHAFSERNIEMIESKQQKRAVGSKAARQPAQEAEASLYYTIDGKPGFPALGFRQAMISACRYVDDLPMTVARGAFFVDGDLIPLRCSEPYLHRSRVVLNRKTTSIAYRACYEEWEADLSISYQENVITVEQIINILELAGFAVGVGAWRPACKGQFGRFEIKKGAVAE